MKISAIKGMNVDESLEATNRMTVNASFLVPAKRACQCLESQFYHKGKPNRQ